VTIKSAADRDFIKITVNDDGRGMTSEQLARIYDPFFTTRQDEGGTGLGMSIVHGIVRAHGGTIRVNSKPQKGTSVVICLPRYGRSRERK
jgi:signal transduction histidine kinase